MKSLALWLAATWSLLGCTGHSNAFAGETLTMQDLGPASSPGPAAELLVGDPKSGVGMNVGLLSNLDGRLLTYELQTYDQTIETETYEIDGTKEFGLKAGASESFEPPLPLLKFPLKVGDGWDWIGKITIGTSKAAEAKIVTRADRVVGGKNGPEDAVLVEAKLSIDVGMKKPIEQRLRFWFARNLGVVKRVMDSNSSRQWPSDAK